MSIDNHIQLRSSEVKQARKHGRLIQEDTIEHDSESLCAASRVKDHQCRRIVDEIVHARKSHRLTPPSMVETGVLLEIGHTSKNVHELLCATGIASRSDEHT